MFTINYSHTDYARLLNDIARTMGTKVKDDTLTIPGEIADGYLGFIQLTNGLQCLLSDFTLNQDVCLQRKGANEEFYILRFDELLVPDSISLQIDNDNITEGKQNRASAFLTSSLYDFAYRASKGTHIKSINVLITRDWLEQYLDIKSMDKVLEKYLGLKTGSCHFAPFDIEYRALFNEVMENDTHVMKNSILENRIMMLVEKFFAHLYKKLDAITDDDKIKISDDEVKRLMEVESYLVKDFSTPPPPISFLSRVAAMSTTTLKNKFKKLYGNNLYEYFQKSRMHKAKVLLLSRKYSIKEIGSQLGYSNLSNFATAFKKEFNSLPSQVVLQR